MTILSNSAMHGLLYGTATLEGRRRDGKTYHKECYFFTESAFFKRKEFDGVMLHENQALELCVNPFSIGSTALTDALGSKFAVHDPRKFEADGQCFIADCQHDRKDTAAVVRYLKDKYLLDTVSILNYTLFNLPAD